jgi:hypothetical protein
MRYIFLTFYLLILFNSFGQTGNYFLSHFSPTEERFDNVCFDIAQNQNGVMYFATKSGILEFDGGSWNLIGANGAVYSLQISNDGTIFWSGAAGFGQLVSDDQGFEQIKTLSPVGVNDIFLSLAANERIYFLNEEALYVYSKDQKEPLVIPASSLTGTFGSLFEIFGSIYIRSEKEGLLKLENNTLATSSLGFSEEVEIVFATRLENNYLIGLTDSKVYLLGNDLKPKEVILSDAQYAQANVIVSGKWLNPQLFVLGTLRGGMIFVDALSGKTEEIINYSTGLPDNEVYTLMTDKSQSVWAAHEYGFTRVSPYLPFRSFSHYEGLKGNLLCVLSFQNNVYVGTSSGLFKLEQEEIYDEIVTYVDVEAKRDKKGDTHTKDVVERAVPENDVAAESKKRGFLRFFKKKRPTESQEESDFENGPITGKNKGGIARIKKTERILRSAHYRFRPVKGIDAKVTHLIETHGQLIATGLSGAFEISGLNSRPILEEPSSSVFAADNANLLFIATYKNEMKTFERLKGQWVPKDLLGDLNDEVSFIFQGNEDEFWFCAMDKVYRIDIQDGELKNLQTISFPNSNFDDVVGITWRNKIMLANSEGFFQFQRSNNSFSRIDSLGDLSYYFAANDNIWFRDAHDWKLFGERSGRNLHMLNLYKDLRFITSDESSENLWLITANNELYKFISDEVTQYEVDHPLILKTIRNAKQRVSRRGKVQFDEAKSAVTLEVVQPDYLASASIEYRYRLESLDKTWSPWSTSYNTIDFPYLPPGDYKLVVQSKDIFGKIKELNPFEFEVLAPYWKRTWFYALEFLLFAALVLLSLRLSTRYRVISRLLSLLTIILLIQFIQTVIGETFQTRGSPVMDFFVQVLVALLILPVEGYLRNLLLQSLDAGSILHRLIPSKENTDDEEGHLKS